MLQETKIPTGTRIAFDSADIEIRAELAADAVVINIMKSGACVHRVTIEDTTGSLEHGWIADLFARDDRVDLGAMKRDIYDYIDGLDINQG